MRENLKKARQDIGMTQQAMASYLHISLSYYKAIEGGKKMGAIDLWDKLEDLLSVHQRVLRALPDTHHGRAGNQ